ncbi:MAG: hypothetical protein ACOX2H_03365 [Saccharofermentanales bacterium]|jgi:hypothetical protein
MKNSITVQEVEKLGIKKISIRDLISQGDLNRLTYFKMGGYHNQSIYTIMATKSYDIGKGYCYWALKNPNNAKKVKKFIDTGSFTGKEVPNQTNQSHYYVIIAFTDSNASVGEKDTELDIKNGEDIYDFYERLKNNNNIDNYIMKINDKAEKSGDSKLKRIGIVKRSDFENPYPSDRFPEDGNRSMAYLFDKFYYSTEKIEDLCSLFEQRLMSDKKGKCKSQSSQTNFFLWLKENKDNKHIVDTEDVQYIVARLYNNEVTTVYHTK